MLHKKFINLCLTLLTVCWSVAVQAQTILSVDGIDYLLDNSNMTAMVFGPYPYSGSHLITPEKVAHGGEEYKVTSVAVGVYQDCSTLVYVDMPSVTSVGQNAFSGCSSLASVNMPSVTSIGSSAFYECPIYKLNLSKNLRSIGNNNFAKVRQINIDATVPPTIEEQSFGEHVIFFVPESAVKAYKAAEGWSDYKNHIFSMSDITNFDVIATAQEKESGLLNEIKEENLNNVVTLKVSGTINGYDIMVMRNKMPNLRHLDLTNATIVANDYEYYQGSHTEDNVIGKAMFLGLDNLISLKLPDNAVTIRDFAISECSALEEVALPGKLESIESDAFNDCKNLKKIIFPPLLKSISTKAYWNCSSLSNIEFPPLLESIGEGAFAGCTSLSNIELPPLLKSIGNSAFASCTNLTSVSLAGVETIDSNAFSDCNKLSEVRLPSTLKSISSSAFPSTALKRIYAYTVEPVNIDQTTFAKSAYESATLYIPLQAHDNYYWDTQWSQFAELKEFDEPYKYFYLNKEFTLNDRFTGEPDIDINPGGGIIVPDEPGKGDQDADDIHIKGDGKNWASIIANSNLNAKGLYIDITIKANRWYFFSFPFKVKKKNIMCGNGVKFIFRNYNGAIRASQGKGGWVDLDDAEEYLFPGKGYIFQASLDCTLSIKIEKSDFGKLPKLDIDTKLDIHASANEQDASWNFVGNPFTAFYDINAMGYNSPITRWNSESNTYEAVRPGDDNAFLNPFEAFFVQCPNDKNEINFSGDNRLTQTGKDKKKNENQQKAKAMAMFDVNRQIINLTLCDGTTTDRTRVVFNPDRMAKYEEDCDAAKFEGSDAAEIYTVEAQAGRLAINERQEGCVQIGYRAVKGGDHTIAAQRMDRPVLLRDNALQITFDLTQGDYHFTSAAGRFDNRFMLLIDNSATGIGEIVSNTGVNVKPTDDGLNISNLNGKTVHVYGANGALYATRTQEGYLTLPKGVYVVEVDGMKAKFMVR